jgi:hypothetical protein
MNASFEIDTVQTFHYSHTKARTLKKENSFPLTSAFPISKWEKQAKNLHQVTSGHPNTSFRTRGQDKHGNVDVIEQLTG